LNKDSRQHQSPRQIQHTQQRSSQADELYHSSLLDDTHESLLVDAVDGATSGHDTSDARQQASYPGHPDGGLVQQAFP